MLPAKYSPLIFLFEFPTFQILSCIPPSSTLMETLKPLTWVRQSSRGAPSAQNTFPLKSCAEHAPFPKLNSGLTSSLKSFLNQSNWLCFQRVPPLNFYESTVTAGFCFFVFFINLLTCLSPAGIQALWSRSCVLFNLYFHSLAENLSYIRSSIVEWMNE